MSKYYAKKVKVDGFIFDSNQEYKRYLELKEKEKRGEIENLIVHPVFELQESFEKNGKIYPALKYVADFQYVNVPKREIIVEDVKGFETDEFKIHQKLFEYTYFYLELIVLKYYKGSFITIDEYKNIKKQKLKERKLRIKELRKEIEQ